MTTCVPRSACDGEIDGALDLIVDQQTRRDRNIPSLGDSRDGVVAELEDLDPPWTETLRVVSDDGHVVGAVIVDWDLGGGRAWIHGPWIAVADDEWPEIGDDLLRAAISQLPPAITSSVLTATVEHRRIAELADRFGWAAGEVNHVLIVDAPTVGAWRSTSDAPDRLRAMTDGDVVAVGALHDIEFPDTYDTAAELATRGARGDQIVLVADGEPGKVEGYVAGRIQPDGDGYVDFLAVSPNARRSGLGRQLVTELCRQLIPATTTQRVCLTVQDGRAPARGLYESLGFRPEVSLIGYVPPKGPAEEPDGSRPATEPGRDGPI